MTVPVAMSDIDKSGRWAGWCDDTAENILDYGSGIVALLVYLPPIGQCIYWLYSGGWIKLPLDRVLALVGIEFSWPYDAKTWVGAAEVVRWFLDVHVSLVVPPAILVLAILLSAIVRWIPAPPFFPR